MPLTQANPAATITCGGGGPVSESPSDAHPAAAGVHIMETPQTLRHGHAIVIGGSLAGLLAARVLARHFEQVTIVERDHLPNGPEPRKGVPQARHVHALLIRGEQIIEGLFPGIVTTLLEAGATPVRSGHDVRWHHFGCWKLGFDSPLRTITLSRPLLEFHVRKRLVELPNVRILDGTVVTRYAADWDCSRLTGVHIRGRGSISMLDEPLRADLVVDASGRGSQTPQRLEELGYERPEESLVKVNFGYASRIYERPRGSRDWQSLYVVDRPPSRRGGLVYPIEGNRWLVTLFGWHGDHPSTAEQGFLEFARKLPVPDVYNAIASAQPLTPLVAHGFPANWRRHYERLARLPSRLIVLGDALCSFNPIYGQGMTVAALAAETLDGSLRDLEARSTPNLDALTRNFQGRLSRVVDLPWQLAVGEDLRFPETPGRRSLKTRVMHAYIGRLHEAAGESPLVAERFNRVRNMLAPRSLLFGRDVLAELLRLAWRRRANPASTCAST
jgi:2-polyprenyl-6-methoxyphenol hydroxylase-like FAD-dependent oxidoreductase